MDGDTSSGSFRYPWGGGRDTEAGEWRLTVLRKTIRRLGAKRGVGCCGTIGNTCQHVESAFSGRRYVVSTLGRLKTRWKGPRSWRVTSDRFADDDTSSWGQEGSRTLKNGWKTCQHIEKAFSGRQYVVSKLGRLMAWWKGSGSWRVMWDRFADDNTSSWGQEGSRTLRNGLKNLQGRREGI